MFHRGQIPVRAAVSEGMVDENGELLDRSGHAIIALLNEAANNAKATCEQAMNRAQLLSTQVRAAEDQIKFLESELQQYEQRAIGAEKWFARIRQEIDQYFFR